MKCKKCNSESKLNKKICERCAVERALKKERGACPNCGEPTRVIGLTCDNLVILDCGDVVSPYDWKK